MKQDLLQHYVAMLHRLNSPFQDIAGDCIHIDDTKTGNGEEIGGFAYDQKNKIE